MSNSLPQLYSYKGQSWDTYLKDMKVTTNQILIDSKDNEESGNVSLLPRKDINTYGICPKMEVFKLMKCNSCNKMLLPSVFKSHREKFHSGTKLKVPGTNTTLTSTSSSSTVAKKKESRIKEKKKKTQPSVPPRPLFPKSPAAPSPTIIANSVEALQLTSPLLETVATDQMNSSPSSQTIMPQKVPSHKDAVSPPPSTTSTVLLASVSSSTLAPSTSSPSSSLSLPSNNSSSIISTGSKVSASNVVFSTSSLTIINKHKKLFQKSKIPKDSPDVEKQSAVTDGMKGPCIRSSASTYQQSSAKHTAEMNSDPKDITTLATSTGVTVTTTSSATCASIGMSPIVGTSATLPALTVPLTTQRVLLTIPGHLSAIQMYSCHPKPLSMPTPVTRRVGGSFILRNQRLEKQKNEIQMAKCNMITSPSYKTFSVLNMHHKPNILKNNPRGSNKIQGIKRTTNDKSVSLEHKQSRLTSDVNGFIIHADVSESAEIPQSNNCLQKKLTIFNMK
ncbi:flocculation protein FLO11 isoform X2 [Agrilus planipennis]|uniref:Flocculation protein FLO11 isoform X2 n=1 Tax=Agrilus planipennis TaxID=224129 RepID=A0A1W4WRF8_AGRPL|nr:flocculation protein FLO11 isoform X2 [Agrilus planipennis]